MPGRFVILEHDYQGVHYDLMLEVGESLRTWRLPKPPAAGQCIPAEASFDHRLVYLEYEGPISGGRGQVKQWDRGTFAGDARGSDFVELEIQGARLCGTLTLWRDNTMWNVSYAPRSS